MYTPSIASVSYGEKVGIGLQFDVQSFIDLVALNVVAVNRTLIHFCRSKQRSDKTGRVIGMKMSKDEFVQKIGVHVEIIQHAIFLSTQKEEVKLNNELKKAIKKLFIKLSTLIFKLGEHDSDFCTMSMTERATPSSEVIEFLKKKW